MNRGRFWFVEGSLRKFIKWRKCVKMKENYEQKRSKKRNKKISG